jgi:hypothetical protein
MKVPELVPGKIYEHKPVNDKIKHIMFYFESYKETCVIRECALYDLQCRQVVWIYNGGDIKMIDNDVVSLNCTDDMEEIDIDTYEATILEKVKENLEYIK